MRVSLTTKYTITIVGLIIAVVLFLTMASYYHSGKVASALTQSSSRILKEGTMNQIRQRAESHLNILADTLTNPLYYQDMDEIKNILAEMRKQQNIIFAFVFDSDCRLLHDGTDEILPYGDKIDLPELCDISLKEGAVTMVESHGHISAARSIWMADRYLGSLGIGISLGDVHANQQTMQAELKRISAATLQGYIQNIALITFFLILLGVALSIVISRRFVKPIKKVIGYLGEVGRGKYDAVFQDKSTDEIGDLFTSFEQMTSDLKRSTVSVEALKLEIQQRTKAEAERNEIEAQLQRAQKMEAVGRLASGVAHDLNNMLSGITSYPELLLLDLPPDSRMRKPLETIQKSGTKASAIVQDLLTLARRGVPISEVVDFREVVEEYLESPEYEKMISFNPGLTIETNFESAISTIEGSAVQLGKILMNLINNAAEAMPEGGIVQMEISNRYVDAPISGYDKIEPGEYLTFSVVDAGVGIAKEDLEHIFEPFYTKKVMGRSGTGLGMAVVWGTVKDHNGYIDIHSRVGEGTCITIYFPLSREAVAQEVVAKSIDELNGCGEKILIVDDIAEQREIASSILTRLGYKTTTAASGEAALAYLKIQPVDLVLLDMIMAPGMDGCETYGQILEIHPHQKAIIASGYAESERVEQTLAMGAGGYIRKPYSLEKLGLAVQGELKNRSHPPSDMATPTT